MKRNCEVCGKEFEYSHGKQKYCKDVQCIRRRNVIKATKYNLKHHSRKIGRPIVVAEEDRSYQLQYYYDKLRKIED